MNLFSDLSALLAALKASPFSVKDAWKAFLKVLNDVDAFFGSTPPLFAAVPGEDCGAVLAEIQSVCEAKCNEPPTVGADPGTVGKIFPGDGSFLKALVQLLVVLAPLFIEPKPE